MRRYGYIMITGFMVMVIILFSSLTVMGEESKKLHVQNEYYNELKEEYVNTLRSILEEMGYRNSGVTMCETLEINGDRTYTVSIHHRRIDRMTEKEQQELLLELENISFAEGNCRIEKKIITYGK